MQKLNLKLKPKLIGAFMICGIVPLVAVAYFSIQKANEGMMKQAFNQLQAVRQIKANQIESFFEDRINDLEALADNPYTKFAMIELGKADISARAKGFEGLELLDEPKFKSAYDSYNATFKYYMDTYGYYDIFLISPEDGDVFFTVALENDFGTELSHEKHHLASTWREVLDDGRPVLSDMAPYAPSFGAPAMFMACPVNDDGKTIGVLAMQISSDAINVIMQERSGMGETGESYLVGSDKRMRSDSYLDPEGHSLLASFKGSVEQNGVDTKAVRESISGNNNSDIIIDYNGNPVLSVYGPLEIGEHTWACISEIDLAEIEKPINAISKAIVGIGIVAGLLIAVFGFIVAIGILKPINKVVDMIKDVARGEGDLTKRLAVDARDEIGDLAMWFNTFMDKLHDIISRVARNTGQLASAATEVSSAAEQLSTGSKEQTNQTAQVSAAIEEMTASILESSKNTSEAAEKAREASDKSQEGSRLAQDTSSGMDEIVSSASVTAGNIKDLSGKTNSIGEIIKVIDDIADQTNLLALNAAIEAARAGEQGRGFAVVADEVRKLAERTTKATKEVAETIKAIQADVSSANAHMEEAGEKVGKGKDLVEQTNSSLSEIYGSIEAMQEMMRQVAASAEEQSSAAEQISKNVENVDRISKESSSGAEQAAAAAEQLSRQAEDLRTIIGGFKL